MEGRLDDERNSWKRISPVQSFTCFTFFCDSVLLESSRVWLTARASRPGGGVWGVGCVGGTKTVQPLHLPGAAAITVSSCTRLDASALHQLFSYDVYRVYRLSGCLKSLQIDWSLSVCRRREESLSHTHIQHD